MRPCQALAAAALFSLASVAAADPVGYASAFPTADGDTLDALLYRLDLGTGEATRLGPIGYVDVEGLAMNRDGALYAVSDAGLPSEGIQGGANRDSLLLLDRTTGAATRVGPLGLSDAGVGDNALDYGLAFTCNGRLWLSADTTGQLWEVDVDTGAAREVGNMDVPITGLAAWGDLLFGISVYPDMQLYLIDTNTAQVQARGPLSLPFDFYDAGLDFDETGGLWATIDYLSPPGGDLPPADRNDVAEIDPQTGRGRIVAPITGSDVGSGIRMTQFEGLALTGETGCGVRQPTNVPGPSPAWLLALAAALAGIACAGLRRT